MKRTAILAPPVRRLDEAANILRGMIVAGCGLALVLAGPVLPL